MTEDAAEALDAMIEAIERLVVARKPAHITAAIVEFVPSHEWSRFAKHLEDLGGRMKVRTKSYGRFFDFRPDGQPHERLSADGQEIDLTVEPSGKFPYRSTPFGDGSALEALEIVEAPYQELVGMYISENDIEVIE